MNLSALLEWEGKCLGYILNHMAEYNYIIKEQWILKSCL